MKEMDVVQAYEFYAIPENGVIVIPEQYRDKITNGVKVILLEESSLKFQKLNKEAEIRRKSDALLPPTMGTKDWKFSREDANER